MFPRRARPLRPPPPRANLVRPLVNDKPTVDPDQTQTIARMQNTAAQAMEQDLNSIKDQLLKEPAGAPKARLKMPEGGSQADPAHADAEGLAMASNRLDKLISGGVHRGDAPVTLPGGAVFEFGSAELRPVALDQLHKLGELIQKSPSVTFTIEGYTDSFGDAAYNQQLSQQRAESVRSWLVQNMAVDPAHIKAVGFGATRFLAAAQAGGYALPGLHRCRKTARAAESPRGNPLPLIAARLELHSSAVAGHYDELDHFYRDVWGDHVHHGLWRRGSETHERGDPRAGPLRCARAGRSAPARASAISAAATAPPPACWPRNTAPKSPA